MSHRGKTYAGAALDYPRLAKPLSGDSAKRATLEAKLSVARLRAKHAPTLAQRDAEQALADEFARRLADCEHR